jgi:LmbE family N-acetylglucosaminyl deacetylase
VKVDALYLSPHLDDVALSCGGQIQRRTERGERVVVLTLLAGDEPSELGPLARELHRIWKLEKGVVRARRAEDAEWARALGAVAEHGELLEALYRRDPASGEPLYGELDDLFAAPHPADRCEEELVLELAGHGKAEEVFAPLAVGGHVDHRLVRRAAERVFGGSLAFYEELPYAEESGAVEQALGEPEAWEAEVVALEDRQLEGKVAAATVYRSQVGPLFGSRRRMRRRLRRYARRTGGERLWRPARR